MNMKTDLLCLFCSVLFGCFASAQPIDIDRREGCSYPDGSIVLISDYSRTGDLEISYVKFRPEDVEQGEPVPERIIISKKQ